MADPSKSNGTESCRANLHVLSKKVVEMSCLGIPQNVCNVSNGQITGTQKNFRFLQNALRNNLSGGFVQGHFYCSVQMVDIAPKKPSKFAVMLLLLDFRTQVESAFHFEQFESIQLLLKKINNFICNLSVSNILPK